MGGVALKFDIFKKLRQLGTRAALNSLNSSNYRMEQGAIIAALAVFNYKLRFHKAGDE